MALIYHLVPTDIWEHALQEGSYAADSLATEGFIHFSTREQVLGSANRFFVGYDTLVVLEVSEKRLSPEHLRYEPAGDGRLFPHYYDRLSLDLIDNTRMLFRTKAGDWEWD